MRHVLIAIVVGSMALFSVGCGGSPEEADTSHLDISDNAEAQAAREAATAKYQNVGRQGPKPEGNQK